MPNKHACVCLHKFRVSPQIASAPYSQKRHNRLICAEIRTFMTFCQNHRSYSSPCRESLEKKENISRFLCVRWEQSTFWLRRSTICKFPLKRVFSSRRTKRAVTSPRHHLVLEERRFNRIIVSSII